jgi:hypothetical protein
MVNPSRPGKGKVVNHLEIFAVVLI